MPTKEAKSKHVKHPILLAEKRLKKISKADEKRKRKESIDKVRRKILDKARRAEAATERKIIRATKNSGRSHKDGDHVYAEDITLDTKNQSTRINPVVNLSELEKVRQDAARVGHPIGALVLRTKNNVGVVVIHESDWPKLIRIKDESTE